MKLKVNNFRESLVPPNLLLDLSMQESANLPTPKEVQKDAVSHGKYEIACEALEVSML